LPSSKTWQDLVLFKFYLKTAVILKIYRTYFMRYSWGAWHWNGVCGLWITLL